jgi:hypothetical protein
MAFLVGKARLFYSFKLQKLTGSGAILLSANLITIIFHLRTRKMKKKGPGPYIPVQQYTWAGK